MLPARCSKLFVLTARALVLGTGLCGVAPGVQAQPAPVGGATTVAQAPPGASEMPKAVRDVFERALREYAKVESYGDLTVMKFRLAAKSADGADASRREAQDGTWAFARPGKFAYRGANDAFQIVSDGVKQWTYNGATKQYTEQAAPTDFAKLSPGSHTANAIESHMPMRILLGGVTAPERMFDKVVRWTAAAPEERDGQPGVRVQGDMADGVMGLPGKTLFSAWFDGQSGLLRETRVDMTEAYRAYIRQAIEAKHDAGGQTPESVETVEVVNDFRDVRIGAAPMESAFTFKPPEGAAKVAYLDAGAQGGGVIEDLLGGAVPDFSAKLLTGEDFSISSLKGRIVVMDFWATWCGPCMKTIPSMQRLSEKYADKPVTILGINQDLARSDAQLKTIREKVQAAVEKNKLTFKHVMDSQGKIGDKFFVNAIPCTVILDQEGIVQDVHVGAPPGGVEDGLSVKIDRLLKGEKLTDRK